jgi:8-oxo-dGTP pyrophosphatase MutT (NUDIX family)
MYYTNSATPHIFGVIMVSPHNKYLLVRGRLTGKWSFPKGHIEHNETPYMCAIRELSEETGINIGNLKPTVGPVPLIAGYYFIFRPASELKPNIRDKREVIDARWFTLSEIAQLPSNIDITEFLSKMNVKTLPTRNMSSRCYLPVSTLMSNWRN